MRSSSPDKHDLLTTDSPQISQDDGACQAFSSSASILVQLTVSRPSLSMKRNGNSIRAMEKRVSHHAVLGAGTLDIAVNG
jgi:hypothetical protein